MRDTRLFVKVLSGLSILAVISHTAESAYQWRCTSPDSDGRVYVPDIPAETGMLTPLGSLTIPTAASIIYLYPIPSSLSNCHGTVMGLEFCYQAMASINDEHTIFTLLSLQQDGQQFTVNSAITVRSRPSNDDCTQTGATRTCCGNVELSAQEQFQLSGDNFAFGIETPFHVSYQLLGFFHGTGYDVSGIQINAVNHNTVEGSSFNTQMSMTLQDLRIVRFIVAPPRTSTTVPIPSSTTTSEPSTTSISTTSIVTATTSSIVTTSPTTMAPTTPGATSTPTDSNTDPTTPNLTGSTGSTAPGSLGSTATDSTGTSTSTTAPTSAPLAGDNTATLIGVIIAFLIVIVLTIVSVVVIVMCVRKRTTNWDPKQMTGMNNHTTVEGNVEDGFTNAVYSIAPPNKSRGSIIPLTPASSANYDYASTEFNKSMEKEEMHEYATADELSELRGSKNAAAHEYAYATTGPSAAATMPSTSPPHKYPSVGGSMKPRVSSGSITDAVYMAPATDENSLYAQFTEIRITYLSRSAISVKEELGSGQFGTVHKAEWKGQRGTQLVAVKMLKKGVAEIDKVKFLQEAAIMGQFKHPNVVKLHGVVIHGQPLMIALELLPNGDLRHHLAESKERNAIIDEHTLLSYCRQVASGMAYLSNKAFVHRDLAARNILVSEEGVCKIADFGMSRDLADETYYISHGGKIPVRWTAPEALHYKKYSTASDVWSFGCVMYEIWSLGHKPFEAYSNNQTISEVDEGYRLCPPPGCPRDVYKLMIECWHPLKSERPTFTEIMQEFSLPDTKLLKWSDKDKAVHPEASRLGAQLHFAENLYLELQESYIVGQTTVGSYEVPVQNQFN